MDSELVSEEVDSGSSLEPSSRSESDEVNESELVTEEVEPVFSLEPSEP